jgi:bile acid:Na+ symporter, BASS family
LQLSSTTAATDKNDDDKNKGTTTTPTTATSKINSNINNKLDTLLSQLTNAFPLFVLSFAVLGMLYPALFQWVNRGSWISIMLASVMCGTGLTLQKKDFTNVMVDDGGAIPLGVACQYLIMPFTAFLVGRTILLSNHHNNLMVGHAAASHGPALFLGLLLVGCSPGGTASNLVSLIAQANVALSVLLTSVSTILAAVVTPLLVRFFLSVVGASSSSSTAATTAASTATAAVVPISVSGWTLCAATAKVVLAPVLLGMFVNAKAPNLSQRVSRFTPFSSVVLVALICGGVVAQNAALLRHHLNLLPPIVVSVVLLHTIGFAMGYWIPRRVFQTSDQTARTISIETGMQNSALAVVLARSIPTAGPLACVPGALSATVHSCLGSLLAAYWRRKDTTAAATAQQQQQQGSSSPDHNKNKKKGKNGIYERTYTGDDEFDPELMI